MKDLMRIPVPAPPYEQHLSFDELYQRVAALRKLRAEAASELDALLPSILDMAFKGKL